MKKTVLFLIALAVVLSASACEQRAATSQEAINLAKEKQTIEAQVDYLISQANSFVSSQKFDEAINTAKYILAELDQNSQEAQGIIESAKAGLEKLAQQKIEEAKAEAGKTLDDVKGKISGFGQ